MFFRRRSRHQADPAPPQPGHGGSTPVAGETAVEFLAEFLRIYGEYAFDLEGVKAVDTRLACESWARRLLEGGAPAEGRRGHEPAAGDDGESPRTGLDLPALRRFYQEHRSHEKAHVTRALGDLREVAWTFIRGLCRTVTAEQNSDGQVANRLRRLEQAVRRNDTDEIKREAEETIGLLETVARERSRRQTAELDHLGPRLEALRGQLDAPPGQAGMDPLCRIHSRATFDDQIRRVFDFCTLFHKPAHLFMLDLDQFKWVNDTHGRSCGDQVLRCVGQALSNCFLRQSDFVARYGGAEFAVLLQECPPGEATLLAERALETLRNLQIQFEAESIRVTGSLGIARLRPGEDARQWIERADAALYRAKQRGRDRVVLYPGDED